MKTHDTPLRPIPLHALAATALLLAGLLGPLEAGAFFRSPTNPVPRPIAGGEEACQFAIVADNNIGEDVRILFSESQVIMQRANFFSTDFKDMSDRRLAPGEKLNARFEAPGSCGAPRFWSFIVRIGPRGGELISVYRETEGQTDRTLHLGEASCWAVANPPHWEDASEDRNVDRNDEAIGCDPETTQYGLVPAEGTDDPAADRPAEEVHVTDQPAEEVDVDQFQGNWVRVESNNPRNNGMRIRVEGDRATITAMPPRGSSRLRVGQVVWVDISDDGSLDVRGSDGALHPSRLTMEGSNRLQLDIDMENSPGNDQTWERAGPSIDGDWVLYYTLKEHEHNWGTRVRVEGDRATIRYVPPTADRGYRVGDIIWREFSPSDRSSPSLYSFERHFGGSRYEPAHMRASSYDDGILRSIAIDNEASTRPQLWGRPEAAEEVLARRVEEDRDEAALPDLPYEPVRDPLAQDPDLEPSDDMKTVDQPEPIPATPTAACLDTSLPHDGTGITWGWGLNSPTDWVSEEERLGIRKHMINDFQSQLSVRTGAIPTEIERSRIRLLDDGFGLVWQAMPEVFQPWKDHRALTASEFDQWSEAALSAGRRPIDVEVYRTSAGVRFAGIWTNNPEGIAWRARHDLTGAAYGQAVQNFRNSGYRLIDMEAYPTPDGIRYAGIWYRSCDSTNWDHDYGMDRDTYQETVEDFQARGFRVVDFESYRTPEGQRYAAVFEKPSSPRAWRVRSDRSLKWFLNYHHRYVDQGFRLIDYESYETADGIRYAGVWGANDARYAFPFRTALDDTIQAYRTRNGIPGLSVVVMQDDDVIYRRGFGWADSAQGKWAHSGTIYLTASIAKVIGATVAARLEEQERLDLSDTTANILDYIDSEHTHTVAQLLGKVGCIRHYDTLFADPNQARSDDGSLVVDPLFYRWRDTAVARIESPLLPNCTPGRHYEYSTHGFTFVGAVLEEVLGNDIGQILADELTGPAGLASMRRFSRFFTTGPTGPVPYYDMAQGYQLDPPTGLSQETAYGRSSWKVLGGGLQVDAMDLARFGSLTLDGTLVSDSVRDNRLWMSQTGSAVHWPDSTEAAPDVGLGWVLRNVTAGGMNQRVAEHGGTARGARSQLQVYRDAGLVVAILTNQRNGLLTPGPASPNSHRIRDFAETVADVVLSNPPVP